MLVRRKGTPLPFTPGVSHVRRGRSRATAAATAAVAVSRLLTLTKSRKGAADFNLPVLSGAASLTRAASSQVDGIGFIAAAADDDKDAGALAITDRKHSQIGAGLEQDMGQQCVQAGGTHKQQGARLGRSAAGDVAARAASLDVTPAPVERAGSGPAPVVPASGPRDLPRPATPAASSGDPNGLGLARMDSARERASLGNHSTAAASSAVPLPRPGQASDEAAAAAAAKQPLAAATTFGRDTARVTAATWGRCLPGAWQLRLHLVA